jgi:hypothetical protein
VADIHVIGGSIIDANKTNYSYVFHIPTNADAGLQTKAQLDPAVSGFESQVPNIDGAELANIQAGVLVEEVGIIKYNEGDTAAEYLERLRNAYAVRAGAVPDEFERLYRWYLNAYDAES